MAHIVWLACAALKILQLPVEPTGKPSSMQAQLLAKNIITGHLKTVYRCLSSGQAPCQVAALQLLEALCVDSSSTTLLAATLDLTHKGLMQAARTRKNIGSPLDAHSNTSPRCAYSSWIVRLLNRAEIEVRVSLSRQPSILHYILNGLPGDEASEAQKILTCIVDCLVFNEEESRNLPVAFLRGGCLLTISKLCFRGKTDVQMACRTFLRRCFEIPNEGLCYPSEPYTVLRNRLLSDIIGSFDLRDDGALNFALELMKSCPDVAWGIINSGRVSFDLNNSSAFATSVALAIKLLSICATQATPSDGFFPKSISRNTLTRAVGHEDLMTRFNALILLVAILKRCPEPSDGAPLLSRIKAAVPDFRTIFNSWRQSKGGEDDSEESNLVKQCFLEVIYHYLRLSLSEDATSMIKASDIWQCGASSEVAKAALQVCGQLNPIRLLDTLDNVKIIEDLCQHVPERLGGQLIEKWILDSRASGDKMVAKMVSRQPESIGKVLTAIHTIHQKPLIFVAESDPIRVLLSMGPVDLTQSTLGDEELSLESETIMSSNAAVPETAPKRRRVQEKVCIEDVLDLPLGDMPITFLQVILSTVKRFQILDSLSDIGPSVSEFSTPDGNAELVRNLVHTYDLGTWLRLLAACMDYPDAAYLVDLRLLVDSGVLGYPIIGLSVDDESLRRLSQFILTRFTHMLQTSRVRESRQLLMLLEALAAHQTASDPFAPLDRLVAYFYAEALPVMLRPDNPLYRPILELHMAEPIVSPMDVFMRFFFDTNDEWSRQLGWLLNCLDRAAGRKGQFVKGCNFEVFHLADNVAGLLMSTGVEFSVRRVAERLLAKCNPDWLAPFTTLQAEKLE